ncbi:MAG: 30S ribosomal protein S12 methylthiotransferase RimO [Planctomycetota bacterium]
MARGVPSRMRRVHFIGLGCAKNLYDLEDLSGFLIAAGFAPAAEAGRADLILVHTCGFLAEARAEAEGVIGAMLAAHPSTPLIVTGCMVQAHGAALRARFPAIAALVAFPRYTDIGRIAAAVTAGERVDADGPGFAIPWWHPRRFRMTPGSYAYLKISEGCGRRCAFCVIPAIRGPFVSQSVEALVERARTLTGHGVRELILVSQDTARYGKDIYGAPALPRLLETLLAVSDLAWLRVMYLYPGPELDASLIRLMAGEPRICPYFDIPFQHVSARVLKRMGRRGDAAAYRDLVGRIRAAAPGAALRTTLITGFPGETEADLEALAGFVREMRFDHLGCFAYSDEPGARSHRLDGKLPEAVGRARRDRIMAIQQSIAADLNRARVGTEVTVAVDGPGDDGVMRGRTARQAPEVDGCVRIRGRARPGAFAQVRITGCDGYDLVGRVRPSGGRR